MKDTLFAFKVSCKSFCNISVHLKIDNISAVYINKQNE